MILITGGAGFIGSNVIKHLNEQGITEIIIVDNFENGRKFLNINDLKVSDIFDRTIFYQDDFLSKISTSVKKIVHLGACSSTQEWDGKYLLDVNYEASKKLLKLALGLKIDFIYASSASVYGNGSNGFNTQYNDLIPLNAYAFSKIIFDRYVESCIADKDVGHNVVGLRFFNVYGPREAHKANMTSPIYNFFHQAKAAGYCNVFKCQETLEADGHYRDFIHVKDCAKIIAYTLFNKINARLINVGTGNVSSFEEVAKLVLNALAIKEENINYIDFPKTLLGTYQNFTKADLSCLRATGYNEDFISIEDGVSNYIGDLSVEK